MGPEIKNNCAGEGQQQIAAMLCYVHYVWVMEECKSFLVVENRGPEAGSNKTNSEVPVFRSELE
jgi:hypothetical protein